MLFFEACRKKILMQFEKGVLVEYVAPVELLVVRE